MRSVRGFGKLPGVGLRLVAAAGLLAVMFQCATARAQSAPLLRITSPADGAVVHPGDKVTVVVTPATGVTFQAVTLSPDDPLTCDQGLASPPYDFSVQVPRSVPLGRYGMFASGATAPGQGGDSPTVHLDVESSAAISSLKVVPPFLVFEHAGDRIPLQVLGTFADGTTLDIAHSTQITYTSSDTNVAIVTSTGVVTAVGTGCRPGGACVGVAMVKVQYGGKSVLVQVNTHAPAPDTTAPVAAARVEGLCGRNVSVDLHRGERPDAAHPSVSSGAVRGAGTQTNLGRSTSAPWPGPARGGDGLADFSLAQSPPLDPRFLLLLACFPKLRNFRWIPFVSHCRMANRWKCRRAPLPPKSPPKSRLRSLAKR